MLFIRIFVAKFNTCLYPRNFLSETLCKPPPRLFTDINQKEHRGNFNQNTNHRCKGSAGSESEEHGGSGDCNLKMIAGAYHGGRCRIFIRKVPCPGKTVGYPEDKICLDK